MTKLTSEIKSTHIRGLGIGWINYFWVLALQTSVSRKFSPKIGKAGKNRFSSDLLLSHISTQIEPR